MKFICCLWSGRGFWRPIAKYDGRHVAALRNMLRRHGGHELYCFHDGSAAIPTDVRSIVMPSAVSSLPDYLPKLGLWSHEVHSHFTERFACIDLDVVILDDLAPALETDQPIRIWDSAKGEPYNSSLFTLEPGHGHTVWTSLEPARVAEAKSKATRWTGDQSWIAHVLGPDLPTFGEDTGVVRYRRSLHQVAPPAGTRAAFLCGPYEPASEGRHSKWIAREWK